MNEQKRGDFIPYPTNRVVVTITDATDARAAVGSLLNAGFQPSDIDILHGEQDLDRLDPTGEAHGFLARFQRTLIRTAGPAEEFRHLSRHAEDLGGHRYFSAGRRGKIVEHWDVLQRVPAQQANPNTMF